MMLIEPVREADHSRLLDISVQTGLFTHEESEELLGKVLAQLALGELPDGHTAVTCRIDSNSPVVGWAYFAPDSYANNVWNLWWIGVLPQHQGSGAAQTLLSRVEEVASGAGARLLIIETNDLDVTTRARRFYEKSGYVERGRIPHFYSENEAKVIYSRRIAIAT